MVHITAEPTAQEWAHQWEGDGKLSRVFQVFEALQAQYPGSYRVELTLSKHVALVYRNPLKRVYAVQEWDDDGEDQLGYHLERFREQVANPNTMDE